MEIIAASAPFAVVRVGRFYRVAELDHATERYVPIEGYPATTYEDAMWDFEGYLADNDV